MMELTFCFRFVIRGNFRGAFVLWGVVRGWRNSTVILSVSHRVLGMICWTGSWICGKMGKNGTKKCVFYVNVTFDVIYVK